MKKKRILLVLLICLFSFMLLGCAAKDASTREIGDNETTSSNDNVEQNNKIDEETTTKKSTDKETKSEDTQSKDKKDNIDSNAKKTSEDKTNEKFYGTWSISRNINTDNQITTYSSKDVKSIIGKTLIFSKDKATAFGDSPDIIKQTIENPIYKETVIPKAKFEDEWKITFKELGIESDSVTEVSVSSNRNSNTCDFLVINDSTLILCGGGTYFELRYMK